MCFKLTRSMDKLSRFARAFTLIELLVVMAVIAILITIAYPTYTGMLERGKATKDMSNLRQIGTATQALMNDNDGVLFAAGSSWMIQLEQNQKYLSSWTVLQSPFDKRPSSDRGTNSPSSPISYGINGKQPSIIGLSASRITNPTGFILFAPAEASGTTVTFQGSATDSTVTVLGNGNGTATTNPNNQTVTNPGGTYGNRTRINAMFADLHCENMAWTAFTSTTASVAGQPDQWTPYSGYQ